MGKRKWFRAHELPHEDALYKWCWEKKQGHWSHDGKDWGPIYVKIQKGVKFWINHPEMGFMAPTKTIPSYGWYYLTEDIDAAE